MKKYLLILILAFLASCEDEKKSPSQVMQVNSEKDEPTTETLPPGNIQKERDALQTGKEPTAEKTMALKGRYRKNGEKTTDCNCTCIDVNFEAPTEWCIVKDKVYISARAQKNGDDKADLYFVGPSRNENPDRELPWDDFDTNVPIAQIQFQPDGTAELDWIGFSSKGEVLTDYAIYGKKTLEGTYKRE